MNPVKPSSDLSTDDRRRLGAFDTKGNPFKLAPFKIWMESAGSIGVIVEPFAGEGAIPRLIAQAGFRASWSMYDIEPRNPSVKTQNTLESFPHGFKMAISNPPYLSFHFAKRKGILVNPTEFKNYPSLYLVAIEQCLKFCEFVALIVPDSFVTSEFHRDRLSHIISLPDINMFADTTMPTCLALWGPNRADTEYWICDKFIDKVRNLEKKISFDKYVGQTIKFNVHNGNLGLWAIDNTHEASIRFCHPEEIPSEKIKNSARLVSRILVKNLSNYEVPAVIATANKILDEWRITTSDFLLTAFKGPRSDGAFRRRIDFANARAILAAAITEVTQKTSAQMVIKL